jgi:gas vesicle protein
MGRFLRNVLIGIGIGLLIAPMPGEELRRLLSERFQGVRSSLSENEQLKRYTQQFTGNPSQQPESDLKNVAKTAFENTQGDTLVKEPFKPAYPEFVDPELNPNP